MTKLELLTQSIIVASKANDESSLQDACDQLKALLPEEPGAIETKLARMILAELRADRRFSLMVEMSEAFVEDGCNDAQVLRQYGQALIENKKATLAINILAPILNDPETSKNEAFDVQGILGRAWKEKALATKDTRPEESAKATRLAFESYKTVYDKDNTAIYQGINSVAIAAWDKGMELNEREISGALETANSILKHVEEIAKEDLPFWDLATAGEASIALDQHDKAVSWYADYATHPDTDAFALAGSIRQLSELWSLDDTDKGRELLAPLRAKLLSLPGGSVTLSNDEALAMASVSQSDYQKLLGDTGTKTYTWMRRMFKTASSVAMIRNNGAGVGTGFLVRGSDLSPALGGELFVLTNSHVVSDPPNHMSMSPSDATVTFELHSDNIQYQISEVVWQSPPEDHDASLLRLDPPVSDNFTPLLFSRNLPEINGPEKQRVYIIGHPKGGEISFSVQDNELLDYEETVILNEGNTNPCRVHYRAPTEPGSSGSPVFNGNWLTIALHHIGSKTLSRLNGKAGSYGANEGIWIQSIRRKMNE